MLINVSKSLLWITLLLMLVSCSSFSGITTLNNPEEASTRSVENKLGVGILSLESTDLKVTSDQAKELLPLWKGLKAFSTDTSVPSAEISAIYEQIQETLTSEQMQTIQQMSLENADLNNLIQEYGAQSDNGFSVAGSSSQTGQGQPQSTGAGFPVGGDAPGGDLEGGMGMPEGGQMPNSSNASLTSTANTETINLLFVDQVITLLQQRMDV